MNPLSATEDYVPEQNGKPKLFALFMEKSDKALVKLNASIPLISLIVGGMAAGKLVGDVSHIRDLMEMRAKFEDTRYNVLEQRTGRIESRTSRIEAFLELPANNRDGTLRPDQ